MMRIAPDSHAVRKKGFRGGVEMMGDQMMMRIALNSHAVRKKGFRGRGWK